MRNSCFLILFSMLSCTQILASWAFEDYHKLENKGPKISEDAKLVQEENATYRGGNTVGDDFIGVNHDFEVSKKGSSGSRGSSGGGGITRRPRPAQKAAASMLQCPTISSFALTNMCFSLSLVLVFQLLIA